MNSILFTVSLAAATAFVLLSLTFGFILYWTLQSRLKWKRRSERMFQSLDQMTWKADNFRAAMQAAEDRFDSIVAMPGNSGDAMRMVRMQDEAKRGKDALREVVERFTATGGSR